MQQILIVDESPTIRRIVRAALARFLASVEFLEAGSVATVYLRKHLAPDTLAAEAHGWKLIS